MALNLYRRHRRDCKSGHSEESRTGEFEERKKGYKRCDCPIFCSGTLSRSFHRQSTGRWEWDDARVEANRWEQAESWTAAASRPDAIAPSADQVQSPNITIIDATEAYVAKCKNRGIQPSTLAKYQTFIKQLRAYCDDRGYVVLEQLTVEDMDRFFASWKDGKRAKAKKLERLKSFVKFCRKRKWLAEDITEDLQAPEGSSIPANKSPFCDAELERIYAACDQLPANAQGPGHRKWTGEDVKDFIFISIYTGLRISDAATFDINKRLKGNDVFLRMHKTKKELYTWIPDWLIARLREREKKYGSMIFLTGESRVVRTMAESWRVKLGKVFQLAGPFEEHAHPHRLRHTFVRILLEKGVPVADVAELIGDTEEMVRRHYSKWITSRQVRLSKILQAAFDDKPNPAKVVSIR